VAALVAIFVGLVLLALSLIVLTDAFARFRAWSAAHEAWRIDELLVPAAVLSVVCGISVLLQQRRTARLEAHSAESPHAHRRAAEALAVINAINHALNCGSSLHDVLVLLSEKTREMFPETQPTVYLLSEDEQYLTPVRGTLDPGLLRSAESLLGAAISSPRIRLVEGHWYQRVLQEGKPVLTNDAEDIRAMMADFEGASAVKGFFPVLVKVLGLRSVMSVPIILEGRPAALLDISSSRAFSARDLKHFVMIGEELGLALGRKRLEELLEKKRKAEALGNLAGLAAHQLYSLLAVVVGHAHRMLAAEDLEPDYLDDLRAIESAASGAGRVTQQLLALSGGFPLELSVFDLNGLVARVEGHLRSILGGDIEMVVSASHDAGSVLADPRRVEEALAYVARDARAAMPEGGRFVLRTGGAQPPGEDEPASPCAFVEGYAMLAISDSRPAPDEYALASLFEADRADASLSETSLMLPAAHAIIRRSGGTMHAVRGPTGGVTVCVYLPRPSESDLPGVPGSEDPQAEATENRPTQAERRTILVVDDEAALRRMIVRILPEFDVLQAGDGRQALRLLADHSGSVDLLITDIMMPGMSGTTLAEGLVRWSPGLRVLFMSGYAAGDILDRGPLREGAAFVGKPFTPDELRRGIAELLDEASG
jgi:CheY-like chemotaxis protein/GAF domain-containing protein